MSDTKLKGLKQQGERKWSSTQKVVTSMSHNGPTGSIELVHITLFVDQNRSKFQLLSHNRSQLS